MADDFETIDMPDAPPELFPAGKAYRHKRGTSTHLNAIVDAPEGGFMITPMLVPGQQDVGRLLRGERATPEQMRIAVEHAVTRGNITKYGSVDEAKAAEELWRKTMLPKIDEYLKQRAPQAVH